MGPNACLITRIAHGPAQILRCFLKTPIDFSHASEQLSVQTFERIVRSYEYESARYSHCYPDHAPIELDSKTLRRHNSSPDERAHRRQPHRPAQSQTARLL
jgi:hypothetical protein